MRKLLLCFVSLGVIIFFLAPFGACSGLEKVNYFPLGKGTQWTYSINSAGIQGKLIIRIEGTEKKNNKIYSKMKNLFSDNFGINNYVILYRKTKNGIMEIDTRNSNMTEQISLPLPVKIGREWTRKKRLGSSLETVYLKYEKIEKLEMLDNDGNVKEYKNCLVVSEKLYYFGSTIEITSYYAPNIGLVKSVGGGVSMTLKKFQKGG